MRETELLALVQEFCANLFPGNDFDKANDAGAVSGAAGTGENAYEMSQNLLALARLSGASKVAAV